MSTEEILAIAPDVPVKAQERKGYHSPYISLQSLEALCQGSETLQFLLHDVVVKSLRYTETVCRFERIVMRGQESNENDDRKEIENLRTVVHDATIASIDALSRNMRLQGKNNDWIKLISSSRASYMKFAILIACDVCVQSCTKKGTHE